MRFNPRVMLRKWLLKPSRAEEIEDEEFEARLVAADLSQFAAGQRAVAGVGEHRWVRPPGSTQFIHCRCGSVSKDDCPCIRARLAEGALRQRRVGDLLADEVDEFTPSTAAGRGTIGADCQADGLHAGSGTRSVRIAGPSAGGSTWRVELHGIDRAIEPYLECYLACSFDAALRVARHLLSGEPVPQDYRAWV